jgi:hypothetical protein
MRPQKGAPPMKHVTSIRLNILLALAIFWMFLVAFKEKETIDEESVVLQTLIHSELRLSGQLDEAVADANRCISKLKQWEETTPDGTSNWGKQ